MDKFDKKMESIFKSNSNNYRLSTKFINSINKTLTSLPDKKINYTRSFKAVLATSCCSLMLVSGIVFAKEIQNLFIEKFAAGETIAKAAEDGYIAHSNSNYVISNVNVKKGTDENILDTFETSIKTNDFFIDNNRLSIEFEVKFDNKINLYENLNQRVVGNEEYIDYENFGELVFTDVSILDEENKLIYFYGSEDSFNRLCKKNNLNYKYQEFNENYLNTGSKSLITEIDVDANVVKLTYNYGTEFEMPKSKKLKIYLNEMTFIPKNEMNDKSRRVILSGEWKLDLEVPEIMVNRSEYYYDLVECDNSNFELSEAKLTNTGLDISLIISNVEKPIFPQQLAEKEREYMNTHPNGIVINTKDDFINVYGSNPQNEESYIQYYKKLRVINPTGYPGVNWLERTEGCYVLDSNGNKFEYASVQNSGYPKTGFIDGDKYQYHGTFCMTQYDATDEISIILDFQGKPVELKLKKLLNKELKNAKK